MGEEGLTEVKEQLNWPTPDFPGLGAFVRSSLAPFVGEGHRLYATHTWKGSPETSKTYVSLDAWEAALASAPDKASVNLESDGAAGRRLYIWLDEGGRRGSVSLNVPDADVEEAKRLLRGMPAALGLLPPEEVAADKRAELWRAYRPGPDFGREWFASFVDFVRTAVRGATEERCHYRLSPSDGLAYTYRDDDSWKADLRRDWEKVVYVSYDLDGPAERARVEWDRAAGEVRVRADAAGEERARALSETLERQAKLPRSAGTPYRQRLQGEQDFYFAQNPTTWEWLDAAVAELFKYVGDESAYTEFTASKAGEQSQAKRSWQEKEPWLEFVRGHWGQVMMARCYVSTADLNCTFEFEPPHDWLALRVLAPSHSRVSEIMQNLEGKLGLQPVEGAPYGSTRSSGYYSVINWKNEGFAKAVGRAVEEFPKYSIRQATVIEEKGETDLDHKSYDDLKTFLTRLAQGKPYAEAHLHIKGPRGAQMAVHATDKCRKLELKSHLPPDKFRDLANIFDEELGLKKIAETKEQAEGQGRDWGKTLFITAVLPVLLALLTSTVLSDQFKNAAIPKRSFHVVNPRPQGDDKAVVLPAPQPVDVHWELQTERWFSKHVDTESPADYQLFANGIFKEEKKNVRRGVRLELSEGNYLMQITSVPTGEQASLIIIVGQPNDKKPDPAATKPTPSGARRPR